MADPVRRFTVHTIAPGYAPGMQATTEYVLAREHDAAIERLRYQHDKLHEIHAALEREAVRLTAELAAERKVLAAERHAGNVIDNGLLHELQKAQAERDRLRAGLKALYECQSSSEGAAQWRVKFDAAMKQAGELLARK